MNSYNMIQNNGMENTTELFPMENYGAESVGMPNPMNYMNIMPSPMKSKKMYIDDDSDSDMDSDDSDMDSDDSDTDEIRMPISKRNRKRKKRNGLLNQINYNIVYKTLLILLVGYVVYIIMQNRKILESMKKDFSEMFEENY